MSNVSRHVPVLLKEVIAGLNLKAGDTVIDATVGGGGQAAAMLEATAPNGRLLGIDWDPKAIALARQRLQAYKNLILLTVGNYADIAAIVKNPRLSAFLYESGLVKINALLLDLGLSRDQLADQSRGFSFASLGPIDMRFSDQQSLTAGKIVNTWSEKELAHIFRMYGEERHAARIAHFLVASRQRAPINSAQELAALVRRGVGGRGRGRINPATRIFQALRLATNRELENLAAVLPAAVELLSPGGRLAVISFHSLEDRIVKQFFRQAARAESTLKIINKKVIRPSREEAISNPSARSAKLRLAEKL